MPKGSPELTEKRKNEILDACERIYRTQGFCKVTIKEISTQISLTRPAVYNYFETKEEILLGLLIREYSRWCGELEKIANLEEMPDREELASQLAATLGDKVTLLRILNMNLYEIEQNSRVERLAEFKLQFRRSRSAFGDILTAFSPAVTDSDCNEFCETFLAFLTGVFPFTSHSEKQLAAMKLAGVSIREPGICEMVYHCLIKILPERPQA